MADSKISALTALTDDNVDQAADLLAIVDDSATETKKITVLEALKKPLLNLEVASVADTDPITETYELVWATGRADTANTGPVAISAKEGAVQSGTDRNQTIAFGYNCHVDGTYQSAVDSHCAMFKIEGNWYDATDTLMEAYFEFRYGVGGASNIRPFAATFNKGTDTIKNLTFIGSTTNGITFNDDSGDTAYFRMQRNQFFMLVDNTATADHQKFVIDSYSTKNSYLMMSADADDAMAGNETVQIGAEVVSTHRQFAIRMRDETRTAKKTGILGVRAQDDATYDSVMFSVGRSTTYNAALANFESTSMPVSIATMRIAPVASQTANIIEIDTINDGTGAVEARGIRIYPKGYTAIRESGNTSTDRLPSTGANTVSLTLTACPGTGTTTKWFPILDTAGALYWLPGVSNA